MAWVVGMADDENPGSGASRGKRRKKQKPSNGEFLRINFELSEKS